MTTEDLPHWDLTSIYPSLESEAFARAVAELTAQLDDLDAYLDERRIVRNAMPAGSDTLLGAASIGAAPVGDVIGGYLDRMNAAVRLYETLNAYTVCHVRTDSFNTLAKRRLSEMEQYGVRFRRVGVRFQGWLGGAAPLLPGAIEANPIARAHAFFLRELSEQSRYLMSEAEETLAAELALSGENAWSKLQGTVCSQLTVRFERAGLVETLPITALQNLRSDPDEDVRRRAYEVELKAWESVREPLAAALNGVKGSTATLNRHRGRNDDLHVSLDQSRIDRGTLDAMLGAMQNSFPAFRRYLQAKAARLGHTALPWWDLFAPVGALEGESDRRYTFPEAREFVVTQFRTFSDRLANLAERAFANRWIDAEPRVGKRGGAFCMPIPLVDESRVLANFDGSLDGVSTLAHELGHAFHNECLVGKTELQTTTPMTLAETASTFCETIVTEAALRQAASRAEELAILETFLIGATGIIVDISSRFFFEREVFARRAQSELSADEFCDIMLHCQKITYGDGLDERYLHPYMWAWKPHYYRGALSFYNYPYAFGLLFGLGLYALFQQRGADFVPDYESLLASTGKANAADLAARFGIDIRQPAFWQGSLRVIEQRIDRYVDL